MLQAHACTELQCDGSSEALAEAEKSLEGLQPQAPSKLILLECKTRVAHEDKARIVLAESTTDYLLPKSGW